MGSSHAEYLYGGEIQRQSVALSLGIDRDTRFRVDGELCGVAEFEWVEMCHLHSRRAMLIFIYERRRSLSARLSPRSEDGTGLVRRRNPSRGDIGSTLGDCDRDLARRRIRLWSAAPYCGGMADCHTATHGDMRRCRIWGVPRTSWAFWGSEIGRCCSTSETARAIGREELLGSDQTSRRRQ